MCAGGNEAGQFSLDPVSGRLSCSPLDRETTPVYELAIEARDAGSPWRAARTTLHVSVLDANDNDPEFSRGRYGARVAEDAPVGRSLLTLTATDRDAAHNARLTYQLDRDALGMFHIDNTTGLVSSARSAPLPRILAQPLGRAT